MYKIYLSEIKHQSVNKEDEFELEILPEKIVSGGGKDNIIRNMLALGEVVQPGRPTLRTWEISSVFEPDGKRSSEQWRELIMQLAESTDSFRMTILRENGDGSPSFGEDEAVILESYQFEEKAGEPGTLYYKIKLRQHIKFEAKKVPWGNIMMTRVDMVPPTRK